MSAARDTRQDPQDWTSDPELVIDEVEVDPGSGRVYAEGWQSWSPATWYPTSATGRMPAEASEHLMRFRPGTPVSESGLQAEGVLVVDPGNGSPARCYGSTDPLVVPTLHAQPHGGRIVVRSTGPVARTEHAAGGEAVLSEYGATLAELHRPTSLEDPPTVWCSWYRYFEEVTAADVEENLRALDERDLPVDVVQIDDGWSAGLGEGLMPSERFGDLERLVDTIRGCGRRAGIWLAPFLVGSRTTLAQEHPDWLTGPAGRNWGQDLVGLDLTHPAFQERLVEALNTITALGVDYLKLDFLYGGAVLGRRYADLDSVASYRVGLELIRETVGREVYLVGCGAPILPSLGLVDAMRVSPDTFHEGGEDGSGGLRGLMPLAARAWQHGRLWVNDPDCVVARPGYAERERWAEAATVLGGLRSFSDRVADLDAWGLDAVRGLLGEGGRVKPFGLKRLRAAALIARAEVTG